MISGIFYTGYIETHNSSMYTIHYMILENSAHNKNLNFTYELGDKLKIMWNSLKLFSLWSFIIGVTMAFVSLGVWFKGYKELKQDKFSKRQK